MTARIAVLAGPMLGHASRLGLILNRVQALTGAHVTFVSPQGARFLDTVAGAFETQLIPLDGDPTASFAAGLDRFFAEHRFDLVVHDMDPLRWLALARFPPVPRVHVTNAFLTGLDPTLETVQSQNFAGRATDLNVARAARGLAPLTSAFALYEADRVLLVDPPRVVAALGTPPPHHRCCGHVSWSAAGTLPAKLRGRADLLVASLGSTGMQVLGDATLAALVRATGCSATVYVGDTGKDSRMAGAYDFSFQQVPLDLLLRQTRLVVSQGGAGSTYQALAQGVPVLVCTSVRNQLVLGQVLERLGAAQVLGADDVAAAARVDLTALRAGAAAMAADMAIAGNGAARAAAEIAALL